MPQPTDATRHTLNRDPIAEPYLVLLEFKEDGETDIVRVAVNNEDVTFQGEVYLKASVEVTLPSTQDGDQAATLTVSNVDRVLGKALLACRRRINVRMILVNAFDLDATPIIDTMNLMVNPSSSVNPSIIEMSLGPRADQQEPVPFQRTTQQLFPGVFTA